MKRVKKKILVGTQTPSIYVLLDISIVIFDTN